MSDEIAVQNLQQHIQKCEYVIRKQMDVIKQQREKIDRLLSCQGERNRHTIDELADGRAQNKAWQAREAELRAKVLSGECGLVGDDYVAVIRTIPRNEIDLPALRRHLGPALNQFMTVREITQVWIRVREKRDAA
jgi:hypothetical protein